MQVVITYVSEIFSLLGSYFNFITSNVVIVAFISLFVAIPFIITMIRRYLL